MGNMYRVVGIDEAGKGPVIGSMFIGFAIINLEKKEDLEEFQTKLKELGVCDSKKLTPKKRKEIYEKLKDWVDIKYAQLTPALIDSNFFTGGKLNNLEISAIVQVLESFKPDLIIIDALTAKPENFKNDILKRLTYKPEIISENKADQKYELVGAASIIAKELREKELGEIRNNINLDVGSGYPSDPKTKEFLKKHYENKNFDFIFRKSWKTYQNILNSKKQKSLDDF